MTFIRKRITKNKIKRLQNTKSLCMYYKYLFINLETICVHRMFEQFGRNQRMKID